MSIHIDMIADDLFAALRKMADEEPSLRDILVDVWVDGITDSVWGRVGERRAQLASRNEIADNVYPGKVPAIMKLLVRNARVSP